MEYLDNLLTRVKKETSKSSIEILIERLILLNQGIIVREIWQRWEKAQSVDGGYITNQKTGSSVYASEEYAIFKNQMNPLAGYGHIDLTLTGGLSENLTIKKDNNKYKIFSTDEKYNKIGKKYGFKEFGLTEAEMIQFLEELYLVSVSSILTQIYK